MRTLRRLGRPPAVRRPAWLLTALIASACTTSGTTRPANVELQQEPGGFTLVEEVAVSGAARSDFEDAVRLLELEQYEPAIDLLARVIEVAPNATTPHIDLGIAHARIGDLPRAEASLSKALELSPRHPVAHNELGIVRRRAGRFLEARQSYEAALAAHPEFHFARKNLAILCDLYLADPACALEQYELYQRANPSDEKAAMWIADLRTRMGR